MSYVKHQTSIPVAQAVPVATSGVPSSAQVFEISPPSKTPARVRVRSNIWPKLLIGLLLLAGAAAAVIFLVPDVKCKVLGEECTPSGTGGESGGHSGVKSWPDGYTGSDRIDSVCIQKTNSRTYTNLSPVSYSTQCGKIVDGKFKYTDGGCYDGPLQRITFNNGLMTSFTSPTGTQFQCKLSPTSAPKYSDRCMHTYDCDGCTFRVSKEDPTQGIMYFNTYMYSEDGACAQKFGSWEGKLMKKISYSLQLVFFWFIFASNSLDIISIRQVQVHPFVLRQRGFIRLWFGFGRRQQRNWRKLQR